MPLPHGARYRVKTTKTGKKIRLAFRDNKVIEAKKLPGHSSSAFETAVERRISRRQGKR